MYIVVIFRFKMVSNIFGGSLKWSHAALINRFECKARVFTDVLESNSDIIKIK